MPETDVLSVAPWLLWLIVALYVLQKVNQLGAEASETWAKLLGPLGRRWRGRAETQVRRQAASRRNDRDNNAADIADLERQVAYLTSRIGDFDELRSYMLYDGRWHTTSELRAVSKLAELPPHLSFDEWRSLQSYHGNTGPE